MVRQRLWIEKVRRTTGRAVLREEGGQVDRVAKREGKEVIGKETGGASIGFERLLVGVPAKGSTTEMTDV